MKKIKLAVLMSFVILAGCSSKPPLQTQPYGELTPIFENQHDLNERG